MKKSVLIGTVSAGAIAFGLMASANTTPSLTNKNIQPIDNTAKSVSAEVKAKPTCDGSVVVASCNLEGIGYKTYIYHPAVAEKSHVETETTYQEKIIGYCTLCNDGTRSPSCATGRGTCSHHDGVAQWDAPIVSNVPVNTSKTVVDVPAQAGYYEKVTE